jgi:hypothetical protein
MVTSLFLSQSYFQTPKLIRTSCDYIIIKKVNSVMDLNRMMNEYQLGEISPEQLIKFYVDIRKKGNVDSFLLIDLNSNDPNMKYRHNFGEKGDLKLEIPDDDDDEDDEDDEE